MTALILYCVQIIMCMSLSAYKYYLSEIDSAHVTIK